MRDKRFYLLRIAATVLVILPTGVHFLMIRLSCRRAECSTLDTVYEIAYVVGWVACIVFLWFPRRLKPRERNGGR